MDSLFRGNDINADITRVPKECSPLLEGSGVFALQIYTTLGEYIVTVGARHALPLQRIDISHLPVALYFIQIENYTEIFIVVR